MEELYRIYSFLPISSKDEDESEYIRTLFKAFEMSYTNGFYQFAYIQLHMIFMVCIYYMLLKIGMFKPDSLKDALHYMLKDSKRVQEFYGAKNTRDGNLYFGSFASILESEVFLLLKIVGMDSNLQGELKNLVKERNNYAHANGIITITSQDTIDEKISCYLSLLERVFNLMKPFIRHYYIETIKSPEFYNPEIRKYIDETEQINEAFIKDYSITLKDLNECRRVSINDLVSYDGFENIKQLHIALCDIYEKLSDEED